jgi:hypothetical protein
LNPHDAYVLDVHHEPTKSRLTLRLRCGDLQRGYSDVVLRFSQAKITQRHLKCLERSVRPASVEVLYDEVDREGILFDYRLLLYPVGVVTIRFRRVWIDEKPVPSRESK